MLPQEDGAWVEQVMAAKRSTTLGDADCGLGATVIG